jgi:hypothetical protein
MKDVEGTFVTEFKVLLSSVFVVGCKKGTNPLNRSFSMIPLFGFI